MTRPRHALDDWARLRRTLRGAEPLLLLTDFDGTLAPIVRDASRAGIADTTRQLLRALSRCRGVCAGVVSGRALSWLRKRVGVADLVYVGNHGLEIRGPGVRFVHPLAHQHTASLTRLAHNLRRALRGVSGTWVEAKRFTLSVHWRTVPPRDVQAFQRRARAALAPWVSAGRIRLTAGKRVIEIRPPLNWDKGKAVEWLIARCKGSVWYLGDDQTDESAFRMVNRHDGVSILVGRRTATQALWWLATPSEVRRLLSRLVAIR